MAWEAPSDDNPVWCAATQNRPDVPTAESVSCTTQDPKGNPAVAAAATPLALLQPVSMTTTGPATAGAATETSLSQPESSLDFKKFTSQNDLGQFLLVHYKIRTPKDLTSCETCHR